METKNLSITTATVDIKVVKIGRSKMTLSVFSQIREEPLYDKSWILKGDILGVVNKNGYYVLWIKNQMLRKTELIEVPNIEFFETRKDSDFHDEPTISGIYIKRFYKSFSELCELNFESIDDLGDYSDYNYDGIITKIKDFGIFDNIAEHNKLRKQLLEENNQLYIAV